jgi:hypothetical protein
MQRLDGLLTCVITLLFGGGLRPRAEERVELSEATGFGVHAVGVTRGRVASHP